MFLSFTEQLSPIPTHPLTVFGTLIHGFHVLYPNQGVSETRHEHPNTCPDYIR